MRGLLANIDFLNSNLVAAAIGFFGAIFTVVVTTAFARRDKDKAALDALVSEMRLVLIELELYAPKLDLLSGQIFQMKSSIEMGLTHTQVLILPSYSLSSDLFDRGKVALANHGCEPILIREVSNCGFEVTHLNGFLDNIRAAISKDYRDQRDWFYLSITLSQVHLPNINALMTLSEDTRAYFTKTIAMFKSEVEQKSSALSQFDNSHPIENYIFNFFRIL